MIISLVVVTLSALILSDVIKKRAGLFYVIAVTLSLGTIGLEWYHLKFGTNLPDIIVTLEQSLRRGIVPTALFILVMYIGVLKANWSLTRRLMKIRGELAIIASIMLFAHIVVYAIGFVLYVPSMIASGTMTLLYTLIYASGLMGIILMLPLFISSFKKLRRQFGPGKWKKLQRWSYLFYFLTYVHVLAAVLNGRVEVEKVIIYTLIFGVYTVLKVLKIQRKKQQKKAHKRSNSLA